MDLQFYDSDGNEIDADDAARKLYSMEYIEVDGLDFDAFRVLVSYNEDGTHWDTLDDDEGVYWPSTPFTLIRFELHGVTIHVG